MFLFVTTLDVFQVMNALLANANLFLDIVVPHINVKVLKFVTLIDV